MEKMDSLAQSSFFELQEGTVVAAADLINATVSVLPSETIVDKKYKITGFLGRGGMGAVYLARHLMLDKDVALKTFTADTLSEDLLIRFQREAKAIGKLNHKNIVQVFDYGLTEQNIPYYTMEFLRGKNLAELLKTNGPLSIDEALKLFLHVAQGLALAHSKGIVHRDIKPANLFIQSSPPDAQQKSTRSIKVVDFGIAGLSNTNEDNQKITAHGTIFGSPLYMSPEQSMGEKISPQSDIYSLGCTLFEAVTGHPPYRGANAMETILLHHHSPVPSLSEWLSKRDVHPEMDKLITKMLAKAPGDRPQSMDALASEMISIRQQKAPVVVPKKNQANEIQDLPVLIEDDFEGVVRPVFTPGMVAAALVTTILLAAGALFLVYKPADKKKQPSVQNTALMKATAPAPTRLHSAITDDSSGHLIVTVVFSKDVSFGSFANGMSGHKFADAMGEVRWRKYAGVLFTASPAFLNNHNNIDVFAPDLIDILDLSQCQIEQKDHDSLVHVCKITDLLGLDYTESEIDDADVSLLNKLSKLRSISLNKTNITGRGLSRLKRLKDLYSVSFGYSQDAAALVTALKGAAVSHLWLDGDTFSQKDFANMAELQNLKILQLNWSKVDDNAIKELSKLNHLQKLMCRGAHLTNDSLGSIQALAKKGLMQLDLRDAEIPITTQIKIERILHKAVFLPKDQPLPLAPDEDIAKFVKKVEPKD